MKKIISTLLAVIMIAGIFSGVTIPTVHAAPGANENIYCYGGFGSPGALEYQRRDTGEWEDISCPYWRTRDTGAISFCLESDAESPHGESYRRVSSFAVYSSRTNNGIRAILLHGYPSDLGGLSDDEAHYATQLALWSWMYESANVGYSFYSPDRLRAGAGYTGVYNMYHRLLNYARNNDQNVGTHGISVSPSTVILNNVGGQLQGTTTVSFNNLNGHYSIDTSKLPSGVTITPTTGYNGQVLTIRSTSAFNGDTINMRDVLVGHDSRVPSNVFWYEPDDSDFQNMVTFDLYHLPVTTADISFRVNTGNINIIKTTKNNNGSVSGFTFEVRNSSNALIGTYTSDSSGNIFIPNLTPGVYSVKEINLSTDFVEPSPNPKSVTVVAGSTANISFDNVKKQGVISVRKTDANFTLGGYSLAGAQFQILDQGGALVDTITTGADGRGQSKILPLGVYRVKETVAPYGFVVDPNTYTVPLSGTMGTGEVVYSPETSIAEQPAVGRVNLQKSNKNPMMGDYPLSSARYEVRAAEDIRRIDGSYYARTGDLVDTMITDADGKAQSKDLHLGKYTVKEAAAPYGYLLDTATYDITLSYGGQTVPIVYASVNSGETPEPGRIRVHKYNESPSMGDYDLISARFEVRADEDLYTRSGALIHAKGQLVDTVITDTNGDGVSKDLPLGKYTVKEVAAPWGYSLNPNTYPAVLSYGGQTVLISYTDTSNPQRPQTGKITLEKYDNTFDRRAQGDATLKGMVVEIYAAETLRDRKGNLIHSKDQLLETLYCGDNVSVTSKEFPLGNYYWKEKVPPTGYNLDPSSHPFSIEYQGQNINIVLLDRIQRNKVIEGRIGLVKHTDLPDPNVTPADPQIEQPLEGCIFNIYLKKAGSYNAALPTERDQIITDADGYGITKLLPYGVYVVEETYAPGDVKLVAPFTVFINSEGRVYRYILNDWTFKSLVKVRKVDSTTGKAVPAAGIPFKVWDVKNNKWVSQSFNYPVPTTIDEFMTAEDGTLVMPEVLPSGDYLLYEQAAPWGYVLSKDPVPFTIHSTQNDPAIAEVIFANNPQMGIIKVEKKGNMLTGAEQMKTEFGTRYIPTFSMTGLPGAVFNIIAAEDIITPDGTLRAAKGAIVDTITTNANGYAESKQLFIGRYELVETKAPEGFVLDKTPRPAVITYAGQEVAVTSTQIGIGNTRQKVEIDLQKVMEKPVDAPPNFNPFQDVIFALYADMDIKAVDGSVVIPKGALIVLMPIDPTGKGIVSGELPFARYFVKEVKTNIFYQLNGTQYPVVAEYAGQDIATAKIQVNNGGVAIPNELKLGRIVITKTGEILVGATEGNFGPTWPEVDNTLYTPVYELRNLPGSTFNIITAEDIYDAYGRLITAKGTVVDTVTTGPDGKATSKLLHLGRYIIVETAAPYGTVLDPAPRPVTLGMDGEISEIITKQVSIYNERQKAKIELSKACEWPENAPDGFNPYSGIVFGLYARENVKTATGETVIPAGALLEFITFDGTGKSEIKTDLPFGKFYVQEYMTYQGYERDTTKYDLAFTYDPTAPATVTIPVNSGEPVYNRLMRGSLQVIKTFEGKDTPIPGVPFTITGETVVGVPVKIEAVTDERGEINLENLLIGTYTVQELDSNLTVGYILSDAETAIVAADELTEMAIDNKLMRGDLRIIKTFEERVTPIKGVKFTVSGVSIAGMEFYGEYKTDKNGEIFIEGLPIGDYTVREIGSLLTVGYILSDEQTATVAYNELTEMAIDNKLMRGDLRIIKTFESKDIPIAGVPFTVTGLSVTGIPFAGEFITDENGEIFIEGLPIGVYRVKELDCELTAGYVLSKAQTVFVAYDRTAEMEINNKLQRGDLKIIKVFEGKDTPISGIPFTVSGVSTAGMEFYGEFVTDENGEILIEGLPVGDYTVTEIDSDLSIGYILSDEQTAAVAADKLNEMTIENKLQRGDLKIIKTFEGKDTPIKGVKFTVSGVSIAGIEFYGEFETDKNGEIFIEGLPIGDYSVLEIGTELTEGYILSAEQTATIAADELTEMTIDNKLIRGDVKIIKTDKDTGKPLAGAKFGLYQNGELIAEAVTDENGIAEFLNIPYGDYEIRETAAPDGYKLNDKTFTVAIRTNGEVITIDYENDKIPEIPKNPGSPKTGDNSNTTLWLVLMGASVIGLVLTLKRRKTKESV